MTKPETRGLVGAGSLMQDVCFVLDGGGVVVDGQLLGVEAGGSGVGVGAGEGLEKFLPVAVREEGMRRLAGVRGKEGVWVEFESDFGFGVEAFQVRFTRLVSGHVLAVMRNVGEVRRRRDLEKEARARYETLLDSVDGVLFEYDSATCCFTYMSRRAETLFGYPLDQWMGEPGFWQERIHPEDRRRAVEYCETQTRDGKDHEFEYRMVAADGGVVWVRDMVAVVQQAGESVKLRGLMVDVTRQKEVEASLRESEELFRGICEAMPESVFLLDIEDDRVPGRILYANPAALRAHGMSVDEMVGASIRDLDDEATAGLYGERAARLRAGEVVRFEGRHRRRDGSTFPVEVTARRITAMGRGVVLAIDRDLTEQRALEEVRRLAGQRMAQADKIEALGTLAGGVAHDFNNILGTIMGNAELAMMDVGPRHAAMESLGEIVTASHRAKSLVEQILTFSREEQLERRRIRLQAVVEDAVRCLRVGLPRGVVLDLVVGEGVPAVFADPRQLHQAVVNLITNACQALGPRGGRIDVSVEGVKVPGKGSPVPGLVPGLHALIRVGDNGRGMDAGTMGRIFDPFFTTKPPGEGSGLGLSVVHGITHAHDGVITVSSKPGSGSVFEIYLPGLEVSSDPGRVDSVEPRPGGGARVLLVDDEISLLFVATRVLERMGYRVQPFTDPVEAMRVFAGGPGEFDLILTDYSMPQMSGLELVRAARGLRPDVPVVMVSGFVSDELRSEAVRCGVGEIVAKPHSKEALCLAVGRVLEVSMGGEGGRV